MVADYLKKFNKQAEAMALDASYYALNELLKKLMDAKSEAFTEVKELVTELREELKTSLQSAPVAETKKGKKAKDPNAPKGALSAFMYFSNEVRDKIRKENPDMKLTDVSKKIGEQWKALSEEDKKPYNVKAEKDKIRAAKEKEEYNA